MIIGCGIDSIEIERIAATLDRFPQAFLDRMFVASEHVTGASAAYYAKRFAAKEAALKAMGMGLRGGLSWQDVWVSTTPLGQPLMMMSPKVEAIVRNLHVLKGGQIRFHVSLSDTKRYAQAMVILEFLS